MYQITMCYAYWKNNTHNSRAAFEVFFRKCPFGGEYAIFAGLHNVIEFLNTFRFSPSDIEFLKVILPNAEKEFFDYISHVDGRALTVYSLREGSLVFPMEPLLRVEGPLGIAQLVETPLLNMIGFPTLVCTNAARFRVAAGKDKVLLEFGLRRAQGPDGGMSASEFAVMGGFDKTSNVLASQLYGISPSGTTAHAFIMSFTSFKDIKSTMIKRGDDPSKEEDFLKVVLEKQKLLAPVEIPSDSGRSTTLGSYVTNEGELASFISYAVSFPTTFCALCDTYDTLKSGVPNYLAIALALIECGYGPGSMRLDSGDLAYLSRQARAMFKVVAEALKEPKLLNAKIVASNDINEQTLYSLAAQNHEIDIFGIGTNLVTCQTQPSMGVVYKLVELEGTPRIKLSNSVEKTTIPGRKEGFRFLNADGMPVLDLLQTACIPPSNTHAPPECASSVVTKPDHQPPAVPQANQRILCRHPHIDSKRCYVIPAKVIKMHHLVWNGAPVPIPDLDGEGESIPGAVAPPPLPADAPLDLIVKTEKDLRESRYAYLEKTRKYVLDQLYSQRADHLRPVNPTPYKVSLSEELFASMHQQILENTPIAVLDS